MKLKRLFSCLSFLVIFFVAGAPPIHSQPSSPFFDLKNEREATDDTGSETEEIIVDTGSDTPADTDQSETEEEKPEAGEEPPEVSDTESPREDSSSSPAQESPSAGESESRPENAQSNETAGDEPDQDRSETVAPTDRETVLPLKEPPLPGFDSIDIRAVNFPDTVPGSVRTVEDTVASGSTVLQGVSGEAELSYKRFYLVGGAVFLAFIGIVGLVAQDRRRKVRVIDSANRTANKYLNRSRSRSVSIGPSSPSVTTGETTSNSAENSVSTKDTGESIRPVWKRSDDEFRSLGIDPGYREALRMYYDEGLTVDQIATRTELGAGEVGLALDLVKRVGAPKG